MLGDIVPNKPVSTTPVTSGYGASSFGPAAPVAQAQPSPTAQAANAPHAHFVPAPNPSVAPVAAVRAPAVPVQPETASFAAAVDVPAAQAPKSSKAPLFITLTGAIIFIGGVAGLFIYALSA